MDSEKIYVREASGADSALIADISRQTFYDSFADGNTAENMAKFMNGPFDRQKLLAEVPDPENHFFIAESAGSPIGYLKMRRSVLSKIIPYDKAIEIAHIYAIKEAIGKGVGKALMKASIDYALLLKMEIIWLGVWEKNLRAIDFYIKWGFSKFSEHIFFVGDDPQTDWLMKKDLRVF